MTNNTAPSAETKVSPRAMEAAMIARLIRDLIQKSDGAIVSSIGWRQDSGESMLDCPRAHPTFSEPQAAVLRLGQYIDRLLYGERFVPDKNPLLRFSTAKGEVCDISLESFSQSALGDDGVLVLPYGHSEGAPGSRSALELKNVGRFALYGAPSVLLRRQQALLPMREIIEARRRHQELLEQQTRTIEEQERIAQQNIEEKLKEGGSLEEAIASNMNSAGDERRTVELIKSIGTKEEEDGRTKVDKEASSKIVNIKTGQTEVQEEVPEREIEALDLSQTSSIENNLVIPVAEQGLELPEEKATAVIGNDDDEVEDANSILNELESAFSEGLKQVGTKKDEEENGLSPDESIKALVLMKEKLSMEKGKVDEEKEKESSIASVQQSEEMQNVSDVENVRVNPKFEARLEGTDLIKDSKDGTKIKQAKVIVEQGSGNVMEQEQDKENKEKSIELNIAATLGASSMEIAKEANPDRVIEAKESAVESKENFENDSKDEIRGEVGVQTESPSALADSTQKVLPQTTIGSVVSSKPTGSGAVLSNPAVGWHQIVFNIDLDSLSGFLKIVDDWMDYELRLQIKEQKCSLELIIPKGELALVSPIISKFKVGPIILKPIKRS